MSIIVRYLFYIFKLTYFDFSKCFFRLTLFRIILGDFDFQALSDAQIIFGPLYFLVYIFFVFFVLINMFIAIINDTYLDVKSNLMKQPSEFQMKTFFKKVITCIHSQCAW